MTIAHKNIPEDGLHEPKGVSTAASDRVYKSNGAGSGAWSQVDANTLAGLVTNGTPAGRRVVTDGSGGFNAEPVPGFAYGTMNLSDNAVSQSITGAADATLNTDSDFQELSLALTFDQLQNVTNGSNYLQLLEGGVYLIDFWANVASDTASTRFALKFVVNDVDFVARSPKLWLNSANEFYNASANGIHTFSTNDQIKLYVATNKTVNLTIEDLTFQMMFIGGL